MNENQLLEIIVSEIKELSKEQREMGKTLVSQEGSLREHMRRTEMAEKALENLTAVIVPVQKHVHSVETVLKILGGVAVCAGFFLTLVQLYKTIFP